MSIRQAIKHLFHSGFEKVELSDQIYRYEDISELHVEATNRCNAACPQCARNVFGSFTNPNIDSNDLSLEDFKKICTKEFLQQIKYVNFNGNLGDPCAHKDLVNIINYISESNPKTMVNINTNGGMKTPAFWTDLGNALKDNIGSAVHFSIDGLQDTNHLYRQGVDWSHLIENVKAFLATGAEANWDFIAFKHNEHQIDEAKKFAKELGFAKFFLKKSGRFVTPAKSDGYSAAPVYKKDKSFSHLIEAPTHKGLQNERVQETSTNSKLNLFPNKLKVEPNRTKDTKRKLSFLKLFRMSHEEEERLGSCSIHCEVKKRSSLFINANGLIFPCCWTAWPYDSFWDIPDARQTREVIDFFDGPDEINGTKRSIKEIVEGKFFKYIASSWKLSSIADGKLLSCSKTCGVGISKLASESPRNYESLLKD